VDYDRSVGYERHGHEPHIASFLALCTQYGVEKRPHFLTLPPILVHVTPSEMPTLPGSMVLLFASNTLGIGELICSSLARAELVAVMAASQWWNLAGRSYNVWCNLLQTELGEVIAPAVVDASCEDGPQLCRHVASLKCRATLVLQPDLLGQCNPVGVLMGPRGQTITQLQETSGARIQVRQQGKIAFVQVSGAPMAARRGQQSIEELLLELGCPREHVQFSECFILA